MGSPAFALPTLEALAREHELLAVYTQPDKPTGRGRKLMRGAVKIWALEHDVSVYEPRSLRKDREAVDALRTLNPDVVVVVAYGLILPKSILDIPRHGYLNVHASLLPKYRGAAPIPAAILAGENETGITLMRIDVGLDTGAMLSQAREPIRADDTTLSLAERLSKLGADLTIETLPKYIAGEITPVEQDDSLATYSPKIKKSAGRIDWSKTAITIDRMVRAFTPWPGTFTTWNRMRMKVTRAVASKQMLMQSSYSVGQVVQLEPDTASVVTGDGLLELHEVQLAGKRAMSIEEFIRGRSNLIGSILHTE